MSTFEVVMPTSYGDMVYHPRSDHWANVVCKEIIGRTFKDKETDELFYFDENWIKMPLWAGACYEDLDHIIDKVR